MSLNADNLLSKTARIHVEERQSSKTNRPYYVLVVTMQTGYQFETFLNKDQYALFEYAAQHNGNALGSSQVDDGQNNLGE
jgi:hypothetical protein